MAGWWRATFLPLLASSFFVGYHLIAYVTYTLNPPTISPFLVTVLLSLAVFLDIFWLSKYTSAIWDEAYVDDESQDGLRIFTVIVSYLLFVAEIVSLVLSALIGKDELSQQRKGQALQGRRDQI